MNLWKPIALTAIAALGLTVAVPYASADLRGGECRNQGNMQAALDHLKEARKSLDKAEHDKGGWRVAAIEATNKALAETNRGCAFADDHK
jgi:hypothetical protein